MNLLSYLIIPSKFYEPGFFGKQGEVGPHTHIDPRVEVGTALAYNDLARIDKLSTKAFDPESLPLGIPSVLG